ncbi:DUF6571 family protein [Nocardioides daejeonensis]|uniref:DUF6571 family protein n=1 Tax=Nocardioides daejeonensis TaxID=1046556 RepID=UPI000D74876B|nr:DUF6571 family protein [Nocardioides daejeonensis]
MAEVTLATLLSWKPGELTTISDQLHLDRKGLVDLEDELEAGEPPSGWIGSDHYFAQKRHTTLTTDLVDYVAEIATVIGALDTAAEEIGSAKTSLENAITGAEQAGFSVDRETGTITDTEAATTDTADAVARQKARNTYVTLINNALQAAADADADLTAVLKTANQGDIDVSGTLQDQGVMNDLRGKTPEEQAAYLLDHPELGRSLLSTLPVEVRQEIGEQLADLAEGDPLVDTPFPTEEERAEALATLSEQISAYGSDPVVATSFMDKVGPDGLVDLAARIPGYGLDTNYEDDQHQTTIDPELGRQMGQLQRNLGLLLDASTEGLTEDGQSGTDEHVSAAWLRQLLARGDDLVDLPGLSNHYATHQVYGYQLLAPMLHNVDNSYLLNEVGDGMLDFETAFHREHGQSPWTMPVYDEDGRLIGGRPDGGQWTEHLDGLRLDWTQGTGEDDPAGFDPMGALMDGLDNNPAAAREFLTGPDVRIQEFEGDRYGADGHEADRSRIDYLLTDRQWDDDHVSHSRLHHEDDEHPGPSNRGALGDLLKTATMTDDPDPATREQVGTILDEIVRSTTTDEQARGHDNLVLGDDDQSDYKHIDVVDPSLRDDLGSIFAYHSETVHETFLGGDNADVGPYSTSFDEGQLRTLLTDLGKDPDANEYLRVAGYEEAIRQLRGDLDGSTAPHDAVTAHMDALGNLLGATDHGATLADITASEDSDAEHNDTTTERAELAKKIVGLVPTGSNPIVGLGFDSATGGLIDAWEREHQVDHSGDRAYDSQTYLNSRRLMAESLAEQVLLDLGYTPEQAQAAAAQAGLSYTSGVSASRGAN